MAIGALDRPAGNEQGEEFCRQLAWRDFFYQVTAAFPDIARKNYRPGAARHEDRAALDAWCAGQTGIPIVDAGLRQLAAEGFMHNRARMITASFLTRNLGIDWRHGYAHFGALLADGDVASQPASRLPRPDRGAVLTASTQVRSAQKSLSRTDRGFTPCLRRRGASARCR